MNGTQSPVSGSTALPLALLAGLLVGLAGLSLLTGAASLPWAKTVTELFDGESLTSIIVLEIRLPRTLLAVCVGGIMGLSGAALQGLLRNPLADPSVFGAPQASAFGAVLALYSGAVDALSLALPLASMTGALLSIWILLRLSGRDATVMTWILAGLAMGALAGAATSIVLALSPNPFAVTEIVFWMMGSFEDRSLHHLALCLPFILLAVILLLRQGNGYRALVLGEDSAASLGIDVGQVSRITLVAVAMGIGAAVSVSGAIGFVGLIAPYAARMLVGSDPKRILWPSLLAGSLLTLAADLLVRLVPSQTELKVGALTALLGAPLFVIALRRHRNSWG